MRNATAAVLRCTTITIWRRHRKGSLATCAPTTVIRTMHGMGWDIHAASDVSYIAQHDIDRPARAGQGRIGQKRGRSLQDDQLDGIAKRDIQEGAGGIAEFTSNTLGGMTEQPSQRNDGDGVHGKDNAGAGVHLRDGDADGHKDEEQVDLAVQHDHPTCPSKSEQEIGFAVGI